MLVSVVPIGNSRGIRIPKSVLQQLDIQEKVEIEIHEKELLIKPVRKKTREGWNEKFIEMHKNGEDELYIRENTALTEKDEFEWEW
ncbi:MAG: AbrB/MazE/SpoVT family DNA-binding domain-containing protein [Spirochaetales bacterium]|nr:AbrB/MazE/SpoVT family DNA-binding domain-containing protein [Spirochaetales bacterium]